MIRNRKDFVEELEKLNKENAILRQQLRDAKETIELIKTGNIDALVDANKKALTVYTEKTADKTYRVLIEKMHEGAVTLNEYGTILYANSCFANMVKVPLQKVIGKKLKDFIADSSKTTFDTLFKQGREAHINDEVFLANDGAVLPVLMSVTTFELDHDFVSSIILTDLTIQNKNREELKLRATQLEQNNIALQGANKELAFQNEEKEKRDAELKIANKELAFQNEEKEKRAAELRIANYARGLIEASLDPLTTINNEGKITDMNRATVDITGLSRENLKGSDFFSYFTEPEKARVVYQEVFARGFVTNSPLKLRHKNGTLTDVLLNGSVFKDDSGNVLGVVIVARDVTDQKRFESELIEAKVFAELATLIAEEAKIKAEEATRFAEEAMKAKQQFLSNMSHEIRTPMNAIIGFTKVVLKTELSEKQKEYLNAIKISGDSLIVLIDDILDLAKVDAGKMIFEKKPFKIKSAIKAMLHIFETKIQEQNLELITLFDTTIPNIVVGDPVRLHQIILNLVSNAVKFTNKGSITVGVHLLHEDAEKVILEFEVTDTGIGISKEKIPRIFENFQQASSGTSRLYGGTGLGLAIVKKLVEAQGGTIRVKSKFNSGSTFSFTLSFKKSNEKHVSESALIEFDTKIKNIKVLVVEDIALNQLLMKTLLDDFGFYHEVAENGKIAIEKLQNNRYDIILMDLQMPEMNGFEATDYIRKTMNSNIPIIALTADVTTVDLIKCKAVGINEYIAKPIDERVLYSKIIEVLKINGVIQVANQFNDDHESKIPKHKNTKCIDLTYLKERTKSNPVLMSEMLTIYLNQTPSLIVALKKGLAEKNWQTIATSAHKMIPSFSIMGIDTLYENMAKKIQEFAEKKEYTSELIDLFSQLERICIQACKEIQAELDAMKND